MTICAFLFTLSSSLPVFAEEKPRRRLIPGGELVGIEIETEGVLVVGTDGFFSGGEEVRPASEAGLKKGDTLLTLGGERVNTNEDVTRLIADSGGKTLEATAKRDGEVFTFSLTPRRSDGSGAYKCGLWVRDMTVGVGTLTYIDPATGTAAALGHGIYDVDTGQRLTASGGRITAATFSYLRQGTVGTPGELGGYPGPGTLAAVTENRENGVFATVSQTYSETDAVEIAFADEVKTGPAEILCTVSGEGERRFDVEITKIRTKSDTKNLVVRVTDPELLALTGGIVQGMSGSPILQNGRLVGAVTHVFLNDPKSGYGILIEHMLDRRSER